MVEYEQREISTLNNSCENDTPLNNQSEVKPNNNCTDTEAAQNDDVDYYEVIPDDIIRVDNVNVVTDVLYYAGQVSVFFNFKKLTKKIENSPTVDKTWQKVSKSI